MPDVFEFIIVALANWRPEIMAQLRSFNYKCDSHLHSAGQEMVILTTNATALQPGYYLFLTYTLLALILYGFLTREPQPYEGNNP